MAWERACVSNIVAIGQVVEALGPKVWIGDVSKTRKKSRVAIRGFYHVISQTVFAYPHSADYRAGRRPSLVAMDQTVQAVEPKS